MREIMIKPVQKFTVPVEAEKICPDVFSPLTLEEIGRLEVWEGNRKMTLSDLFQILGDQDPASAQETLIILEGDLSWVKRVGEKMTAGKIEVRGNVGMHAGNGMNGGTLIVEDDAGDWLGREMRGGQIVVKGNAGDYAGSGYRGETCGMRGGELEIEGRAGDYLGEHMCGGQITVKGDCGDFPGVSNRGGTIVIGGNAHLPGAEMTKGTVVVKGRARVLPSYQFLEMVEMEGLTLHKFVGDLVGNGKGELYAALVEGDVSLISEHDLETQTS